MKCLLLAAHFLTEPTAEPDYERAGGAGKQNTKQSERKNVLHEPKSSGHVEVGARLPMSKQQNEDNPGRAHQKTNQRILVQFSVHCFRLQRSQRAARKFFLEIDVPLFPGDQIAQHTFDAAMPPGKLNHSFGERRAPKISIEASPHL